MGPGREVSMKRCAQRGAGHVKAVIWTLILASLIYVSFKVVPILVNEYQFSDAIQNIARQATVTRRTDDQIRKDVLDEAQKDDLPVQVEDIKVDNTGKRVRISANISVTVDLSVYKWTLNFHPEASNDALV
jgi:hypothetical protein